jgi:hypothetical protein
VPRLPPLLLMAALTGWLAGAALLLALVLD